MTQAEQVEPISDLDQSIKDAMNETKEDPAPQLEEVPAVEKPEELAEETATGEEKPKVDGFQKRINKVTADKWEEKLRADNLQAELDSLKANKPVVTTSEPKLEDFDYDEAAHQTAVIDYKVDLKAQSLQSQQQEVAAQTATAERNRVFNERSDVFEATKEDFKTVLGNVPTLQPTVLQYVMEDPKGPELAYYLGTHLDIADKIVQMNPIAAAVEIGKISMRLTETKPIKTSSAPEPIEPITSGGVIESEIDGEMSMADWMKTYNP